MICLYAHGEPSNPVFVPACPQAYVSGKKTSRLPEAVDRSYCRICLVTKLFGLQNNSTLRLFYFIAQKCYVGPWLLLLLLLLLQTCAVAWSATSSIRWRPLGSRFSMQNSIKYFTQVVVVGIFIHPAFSESNRCLQCIVRLKISRRKSKRIVWLFQLFSL